MITKNIASGTIEDLDLENGFHVLIFQNQEDTNLIFEKPVNSSFFTDAFLPEWKCTISIQ